jgi:tetratricopeptide (TPR) repeat protein
MDQGSFIDYYEDLQISPNADLDTIERVYRLLAKRYHPDNQATGSIEKFEIITIAYKALSDPEKRAAYDAKHEEFRGRLWEAFSEQSSSQENENDKHIRRAILSILYIERRQDPSKAGVGVWRLEQLMGWPEKILEFHIWYLKEKQWIERTDTGGFAITASGVDEIENVGLIMGKDRLLTESTESIDISVEDENINLIEGISSDMANKFEEAIENLNHKTHSNPDNINAWVFLAYLNRRLGFIEEAEKASKRVLKIDPEFSSLSFVKTLNFKVKENRKRFYEHLLLAGLT